MDRSTGGGGAFGGGDRVGGELRHELAHVVEQIARRRRTDERRRRVRQLPPPPWRTTNTSRRRDNAQHSVCEWLVHCFSSTTKSRTEITLVRRSSSRNTLRGAMCSVRTNKQKQTNFVLVVPVAAVVVVVVVDVATADVVVGLADDVVGGAANTMT